MVIVMVISDAYFLFMLVFNFRILEMDWNWYRCFSIFPCFGYRILLLLSVSTNCYIVLKCK